MTKIPAWSYSSLTKFETCPRQYQLTRVTKVVKDAMGKEALWGQKVHSALEHRVKFKTPLPEGMGKWEPICARFDKAKGRVFTEQQMALTKNLTTTGWWDKDAWCRGVIDVGVDSGRKAVLLDYKTGKVKHDMDQLKMFAAVYMSANPAVEQVRTGYVWLVNNTTTQEEFTRADLPELWQDFTSRSQRLDNAYQTDKWLPRPSGLCNGWCPAKGHCEFWKPPKT